MSSRTKIQKNVKSSIILVLKTQKPYLCIHISNRYRQNMNTRPTILITNDDGFQAQGIRFLTEIMRRLGNTIVVAPSSARSGAGCSLTSRVPVSIEQIEEGVFSCSGTPVDCVKIALEKVLPCRPNLIVSGINHGDNASVSLHYSGTVGAVLEGCMKGIPSIAYSLRTNKKECNFNPYTKVIEEWADKVLHEGLPTDTCLNINFPEVTHLEGAKVCRMARGIWHTEWDDAGTDAHGKRLYTLTGTFCNLEPDATDTDYWAIDHNMAAITPLSLDMTDRELLAILNTDLH